MGRPGGILQSPRNGSSNAVLLFSGLSPEVLASFCLLIRLFLQLVHLLRSLEYYSFIPVMEVSGDDTTPAPPEEPTV